MSARAGSDARLVVAITGASGIVYGVRALQALRDLGVETHLVVSPAGHVTRKHETELSRAQLAGLADVVHRHGDVGAAIASGSFRTAGMIVAPCSMRTLGEIAGGVTSSLISRAAEVTLKERRRLVLMTRESPLTSIHLRNMAAVTEAGAVVLPPTPAFYTHPGSVADIVDQIVGRALDLFGLEVPTFPRWGEDLGLREPATR